VLAPRAGPGVDLVSAADDLGVTTDTVDVVLLPHTLEIDPNPHGVLREVNRVLRPDGHVVVLGFNPHGFWGLRHLLSRDGFPPGLRHAITEGRIADWLRLLNLTVSHSGYYHYQPPLGRYRVRRGRVHENGGGPRWVGRSARRAMRAVRRWPPFAGCYLMVARKTMFTATPLRPARAWRPRLVGGLVNPTTRSAA